MSTEIQAHIGSISIEIVSQGLLHTSAPAVMLSANNKLEASPTRWSWSQEVEKRAGPAYCDECAWLSRSAGTDGLPTGSAVVTGAGSLAQTTQLRRVIQAITIGYDKNGRIPASPEIVYRSVRAGLEKAEIYRIPAIATYLMAIRPTYGTAPPEQMAEALFRALADHAAMASSLQHIYICETDPARYQLALSRLDQLKLS